MKGGIKKEYRTLSGKPVLARAILPFITSRLFNTIVVTVPVEDIDKTTRLLQDFLDVSSVAIVGGGETRQESVFSGLKHLKAARPHYVLIHDGARPWINESLIREVFDGTIAYGACIPVVEIPDAPKEVDDKGFIQKNLNRDAIRGAQTPQGFLFNRLFKAHHYAREHDHSALDDAQIYMLLFSPVATIMGNHENKKITYRNDLEYQDYRKKE
ncbi:MAG: 2-C-methyl-D-erythritol 4-phosphate cytidylyltransferase [Spirochaetales bacterium]|nr:2-C-methyl-D-erythritol 4-phosphate cytidylyltransferase [Spirochaetales bacterium]